LDEVRVITWNMGGFAFRKKQAEAWAYLENTLKPDIALLQEVPRSKFDELSKKGRAFAYHGGKLGTMVYCAEGFSAKVEADETMSHCSSEMYLAAADVLAFLCPFVLISAHVNPDKEHKAHLRKLIEMLDQAGHARPIIIGGDFNACRHYDEVYKRNACSWFFDGMRRIGFYDCHFGLHGEEKRTHWSKKTSEPYQDDHLFVSSDWKDRIISCDILPYDPAKRLSDHGPVELVIDLPE
jgi:exonuclease III